MLNWFLKLVGAVHDEKVAEKVSSPNPTRRKVTNVEKAKFRKKSDLHKFTKPQLKHLLDVYENNKHGVKSYPDLCKYGNKKYGLTKVNSSYYQAVRKYKKELDKNG